MRSNLNVLLKNSKTVVVVAAAAILTVYVVTITPQA